MVNAELNLFLSTGNFRLKRCDALLKLCDRKRIEILQHHLPKWVIGAARQIVFRIHAMSVDAIARPVNMG